MSGSSDTGKTDYAWSVEQHGIEPIPPQDRHGRAIELFRLWVGANTNYVVVATGALIFSMHLSLLSAISAIVVGNLAGCLVLGLTSIMGPRSGTSGIMTSRSSFGQLGSFLPKGLNVISALSWFSINSILATQALAQLFTMVGYTDGSAVWVALTIVLFLEILLAIYGHATIIASESYIAIILGLIFCVLTIFVLRKVDIGSVLAAPKESFSLATWFTAVSLIFAYPLGWSNYASDYSRYFPESMSWRKVAFAAGAGQFVPVALCEILGVLLAIAVGGNLGSNPVTQLSSFLPTWFKVPLLISIVLGGVAANVPNGYTASLGMLALRIPIKRVYSLLVIAGFTMLFRITIIYYGDFFDTYQSFLTYMAFWIAPWAGIVIVDYFLRGGVYKREEWMKWRDSAYWFGNGVFWPGVTAFTCGILACFMFSNSATFVNPIAARFGMGDFSCGAGFIMGSAVYFLLARRRIERAPTNPDVSRLETRWNMTRDFMQ